jgi:hypothetical protein
VSDQQEKKTEMPEIYGRKDRAAPLSLGNAFLLGFFLEFK